jgi:electron transfer flavoprotein alpha subunit
LRPRAVLLAGDTYSQEIAPSLAYRLGGSAAGDGVEVRVAEGGRLRVSRQVYGGKALAVLELKRCPAVVWLRARSFAPARARAEAGAVTRAALSVRPDTRTRVVERRREGAGEARLEEARVIVSGGRGIGGSEPFETELKPLAELLGAQLAASRAACDAGRVPPTWQVGQTGKKVTPELYLAVAITGASQHMAGISEARTIAAINTDPGRPHLQTLPLRHRRRLPQGRPAAAREAVRVDEMNAAQVAEATREIYWNVTHVWAMYALLAPTALVAGYGVYRHRRLARRRQGDGRGARRGGRVSDAVRAARRVAPPHARRVPRARLRGRGDALRRC